MIKTIIKLFLLAGIALNLSSCFYRGHPHRDNDRSHEHHHNDRGRDHGRH